MPTYPANGTEIKRLRDANRWTQEELAEKAGVGKRTISKLENGGKGHPRATFQPIAEVFEVPRSQLMLAEEPPEPPKQDDRVYHPIGMEILDADFEDFDADKLADLEQTLNANLKQLTNTILRIVITRIRRGSVMVEMEADREAIWWMMYMMLMPELTLPRYILHIPGNMHITVNLMTNLFSVPNPKLKSIRVNDEHFRIELYSKKRSTKPTFK